MRSLTVLLLLVLAAGLVALLGFPRIDDMINRVTTAPVDVQGPALALHDSLWIADFHNDALLWNRGLLERHGRGHVDLPRLQDGGVDLAVFSASTRFHATSSYTRTLPFLDILPVVAIASGWPRAAWFDPYQRALFMARTLHRDARGSGGRMRVITSRAALDSLASDQAAGARVTGAVLLLEGMHAADGQLARVDSLFAAGYRIFGMAHMFDNDVAGSAQGWHKGGLTPFGRQVVARIDSLGGIIDLAHASAATIDDVLALTSRPVVVSHTGLTSTCPGPRNISDDVVTRVATRGGVIAIGFWSRAVCGKDAAAVARAIHHAIEVAGDEHVALGSDFDGGVGEPFDAAHMAMLTQALMDEGLTDRQIRRVMGENERAFLRIMLPASP
ncbi:MAG TPA: membrane dipeptidase [Candidatus Krumholzibacteria bacterium]|nr:membrane dipeptidase [Candidatus Krumholzibacteria bacterium]